MSAIEERAFYKDMPSCGGLEETSANSPGRAVPPTDISSANQIPVVWSEYCEPNQRELAFLTKRQRSSILARLLGLVAGVVAVLAAALHSDVRGSVIDTSKIMMDAVTGNRSGGDTSDTKGNGEPSPKDIVNADHEALRSEVGAAHKWNEAAARPKTPDVEVAALTKRAKSFLAVGDVSAARLLLERAANSQDANAAFLLAQTYDPAVLGLNDTRSVVLDLGAARDWYRKAASLGSAGAQQRLARTQK
jgi:hypothetical protein